MIEIKSISKNFGSTQALRDIDVLLEEGQCFGLIGPNACGKTTLIKSILGMVIPSQGDILFNEKSIIGDVSYRSDIGYMPQIGKYPENMTVAQVINTIRSIRKYKVEEDLELYHAFDIGQIAHKKMRALSGGTTQKVSATIAFLFNPKVLILDEPTAGLDPLAADILKEKIVREHKSGKLILITSHLLSELDDLLTHVIFMQEGSILFNHSINALLAHTGQDRVSKAISHVLKTKAK
ncbi:MAG: ABC transporter ATP-binding protein [Saprospiraceae bacterium]|nr:ABC transporter ATP-binding protein [Saprospiraceae bacterium]